MTATVPATTMTPRTRTMSPAIPDHLRLNHIDGRWQPASDGATFADVNPADTTDVIGTFAESTADDARAAVAAAVRAGRAWEQRGPIERGDILFVAAEAMSRRSTSWPPS